MFPMAVRHIPMAWLACIALCALLPAGIKGKIHNDHRVKLHKDLFEDYNKNVRPVKNKGDMVNVKVVVLFGTLIELNERAQVFTGKWFMHLTWIDEFLSWDAEDYDNVTRIVVPANTVWLPDLKFYSSVDIQKPIMVIDTNAALEVYHDGFVHWDPVMILKSTCDIKVADFPFDQQHCNVTFAPWLYNSQEVNYTIAGWGDGQYNIEHCLWDIDHFTCSSTEVPTGGRNHKDFSHNHSIDVVQCQIQLQRKPLFYILNIFLPIVVLLSIGCLCFFLPVEDGSKVRLSITVLLSMTVFLIMVMNSLPVTSDSVPHLQIFILLSMVLLGVCVMMSVSIIGMFNRSNSPRGITKPPYILTAFFLKILGRILLLDYRKVYVEYLEQRVKWKERKSQSHLHIDGDGGKGEALVKSDTEKQDTAEGKNHDNKTDAVMKTVWISMAVVLNRLCLVLYLICIISMIIFVLSKSAKK